MTMIAIIKTEEFDFRELESFCFFSKGVYSLGKLRNTKSEHQR